MKLFTELFLLYSVRWYTESIVFFVSSCPCQEVVNMENCKIWCYSFPLFWLHDEVVILSKLDACPVCILSYFESFYPAMSSVSLTYVYPCPKLPLLLEFVAFISWLLKMSLFVLGWTKTILHAFIIMFEISPISVLVNCLPNLGVDPCGVHWLLLFSSSHITSVRSTPENGLVTITSLELIKESILFAEESTSEKKDCL